MDYFYLFLFKVILALCGFVVIYKIFLYIVMSKLMKRVLASSDEEKCKITRSLSRPMPIYRIFFWLTPFYLLVIVVMYIFNLYDPYFAVSIVLMYFIVLEDYFYRKRILNAISTRK